MYLLLIDSEQAGMLLDAAHAADAILSHRASRVDPDGVVTKSMDLQKRKLVQVMSQLALPVEPVWEALSPEQQLNFRTTVQAFHYGEEGTTDAALYRQIFLHFCHQRSIEAARHAQNQTHQGETSGSPKDEKTPADEESGTGK